MKFSFTIVTRYGSPAGKEELDAPEADVNIEVEASKWAPIAVTATPADEVLFVDGVRRIDANLWIEEEDGTPMLALAASYGAGAVLCNHSARIVAHEIRRGIFTAAAAASPIVTRHADYNVHPTRGIVAEDLWLGLQQRMGELEGMIVASHTGAPLIVVDGPLSHHRHVPGAVVLRPSTFSISPPTFVPFSDNSELATGLRSFSPRQAGVASRGISSSR